MTGEVGLLDDGTTSYLDYACGGMEVGGYHKRLVSGGGDLLCMKAQRPKATSKKGRNLLLKN